MTTTLRTRILARLRRVARVTARVVAWTLLSVIVLVVLVLALAPTRRFLLEKGLEQAGGAMPAGRLTVEHSDWPTLGTLQFEGVAWTDSTLTLARIDTLRLVLDITDLLRRDVTVREVLVAGVSADLPAIQARLPVATAPADSSPAAPASPPPFPRQGSLPPVPSLAIERLAVRRVTALTAPEQTVQLDSLTFSADLRHGRPVALAAAVRALPLPDLGLSWRLAGTAGPDTLLLDLALLQVEAPDRLLEPSALPLEGRLRLPTAQLDSLAAGRPVWPSLQLDRFLIDGYTGQWRLDVALDGRRPGHVQIHSRLAEPPTALLASLSSTGFDTLSPGLIDTLVSHWAKQGEPGLTFRLDVEPPPAPQAPLSSRLRAHGEVLLPSPAALTPLLPPQLDTEGLGAVLCDLDLRFDGQQSPPSFAVDLDLGATDWFETAHLAASGDTAQAVLDSLVLRLPGLALLASGRADRDSVRLDLAVSLPDSTLLARWQDPVLAGIEVAADLTLAAHGAWPLPHVDLGLEARYASPMITVPRLTLTAGANADTIALDLSLPQGLQTATVVQDSLYLGFHGAASDSLVALRGRYRLGTSGPRLGLILDGFLDARDLMTAPAGTLTTDTLALQLAGQGLTNPAPWRLAFSLPDTAIVLSDLALAGELGRFDLDAAATMDSLAARLGLDLHVAMTTLGELLPPEARAFLPAGILTAGGEVQAAGAPTSPWAQGHLQISLSENPDVADLAAEADLVLGGAGSPPASLAEPHGGWREHSARVNLALRHADTTMVRVTALVPLPRPDAASDSVLVRLDATRMDLARLGPLLPPGTKLSGFLDADAAVTGLMKPDEKQPDLDLSGGLELSRVRTSTPDGSWLSLAGRVELSGNTLEPVVEGGLDIEAGLVRIPEPPPVLLPASGEALLWTAAAPADTSLAAAEVDTSAKEPPLPAIIPELTFRIHCPGDLWLRGQGLDFELVGDLTVHLREGKPAVEGELEARQGTARQLGHVFRLDRGRVIFYADEDELNPELDMLLSVRVGSYTIRIELTGTANDPHIEFSSDPDMTDGDIMATLLFGKPASELDEGQAGLMADRAAQLATAYGSVALQESVAKELGVDVLTIAPREGSDDANALTVGKYLNPKVLVRYEQLLEGDSAFFVHLDYSLTRLIKFHTQVSQGDASGAEIMWEKDW